MAAVMLFPPGRKEKVCQGIRRRGEERRGVIASVNVSSAGAGRVVCDQVEEEKERHSLSSSWSPRER